jgi:hypothetical protein
MFDKRFWEIEVNSEIVQMFRMFTEKFGDYKLCIEQ